MSITSRALLIIVAAAAVVLPLVLVIARRRTRPSWGRTLASWVCVVLAQVLAVAAVGLKVNREFGFYTSWDDALGRQSQGPVAIEAGAIDMSSKGSGTVKSFTISRPGAGSSQALAWLPPGYDEPKNAKTRYPFSSSCPVTRTRSARPSRTSRSGRRRPHSSRAAR